MNSDRTLWIGKDHVICEDYALSGKSPCGVATYAIVCDGCSASTDVDVGARLLAMAARENIMWDFMRDNVSTFGLTTINNAYEVLKRFPMVRIQCLDSTLFIAYVQNKRLTVFGFGDGVIVHKNKLRTDLIHIQLSSGAPDYLSYHLEQGRMEAYGKEFKDSKKVVWTNYDGIHDYKPFTPFVLQRDVEEGDVIAVISDGINSFRKADYTPIPWQDLIEEFTGFKNFEGEFVQRRIGAFKRKCLKDGITHSDDISVAAILV